jgi:hypothetical protein
MPENEPLSNGESKPKVEFTPEQQGVLDGLINAAFAKAFEKAEVESGKKIKTLEDQLNEMKAKQTPQAPVAKTEPKIEAPKTVAAVDTKINEETAALRAQLEEVKAIAEALKTQREEADKRATEVAKKNNSAQIKEAFITASEKVNFFDRMSEFKHMADSLQLDENGEVVVINPATKMPRLNTNVQAMSLEEFVTDYAKQRPWTVKAPSSEVTGGSGAGENRKVEAPKTTTPDIAKMSNEELLAEAEKVIAKQYQR